MSEADDPVAGTRSAYEAGAEAYRQRTLTFAPFKGLREEVEEFAAAAGTGIALEVGTGSGRDLSVLAEYTTTVGLDLTLSLLRGVVSPRRVQGNALALPFRSGTFGSVWCSATLLHLPKQLIPLALSEIARVLRPGGLTSVSVRHGTSSGWRESPDMGPRWFTDLVADEILSCCVEAQLSVERHWIRTDGEREWLTVWARPEPRPASSSSWPG